MNRKIVFFTILCNKFGVLSKEEVKKVLNQ